MKLSIIIPTYNRSQLLSHTLQSIADQIIQEAFEVIVIDNGSNDNTKDIVDFHLSRIQNLIYMYDAVPGLLTGRHCGVKLSKGEILCFIDDDVILDKHYASNLIKSFEKQPSLHLATGPSLPNYEVSPPEWLTYFWESNNSFNHCSWLSLLDFGTNEVTIDPNFVWGLNFCIRKKSLIECGGFHPDCMPSELQEFQGDGETGLTLKARDKAMMAKYIPTLKLYHFVPATRLTVDYFKKRAFYQGVCNSFTALRNPAIEYKRSIRDRLHPYYRWIKHIFLKKQKREVPIHIEVIQEELRISQLEGYQFHQQKFLSNQSVKDWVLRDSYWDYKLPNQTSLIN
ncbi:glycosyltransferase family 2 protein [Pedobacter xixiisoli]|uniref:Glycosyltransferase involved in cell wall bisynthesis n=1 Tax=Pedobacter xixiisoli TaxID=1476464 RepID=A0A286A9R0_9SPHI|nr:glycosyltransferase family 2 protein [Pedobacter xixiisoli]SOD18648.1 Glycosyltransferase involved in cell wall bisynthesis [Pedobacter xixiisoli]